MLTSDAVCLTGIHVKSGTYRAKDAIELQSRLLCFWSIAAAGLVISVTTASAFYMPKNVIKHMQLDLQIVHKACCSLACKNA